MFLALMHLLDKRLGLLLVDKGQAGGTGFELECMKEGSVLVVSEFVIDLLIPDHAPASGLHKTRIVSTSNLIFNTSMDRVPRHRLF